MNKSIAFFHVGIGAAYVAVFIALYGAVAALLAWSVLGT
jgi:hypothetical protein